MIRVALLSRWHVHANDYAREANEHPDIVIQAVWDEDKERGNQWAQELNVDFEENITTLLNRSDIDAVIVDTPTSMHTDVILEAAKAKKHIFSEKVLALTEEDCSLIFESVKENQVSLMLSLPRLNDPSYLYAQDALDQGLLGDLTSIRCRLEHGGALATDANPNGWLPAHFYDKETCGGGALIDLGAHPIYLTNRLAGQVNDLYCQMNSITNREVDDHSTVLVNYASGASGVIEAGFVADKSPFLLELHGTKGSILVEDRSVRIRSSMLDHSDWHTPELPAQADSAMTQWIKHIQTGEQAQITEKDMLDLTRINQAAKQSAEEGRRISL
ncbi:putative dehydrogenase [Alkalihalobacillus xiaoxiensis]|uniref:Dehydrogenase n=1 Tax=Shouchella xiaoxiensis TaxID=766895 RepID=A0ABS2SZW5_9BACI|nr:Gfo/Idh/MocA family oxidoreductase [Shouchella xiaoxiensis]MBM7840009.1 putative dehydrogenase [Shouchella xiaoxiensis]